MRIVKILIVAIAVLVCTATVVFWPAQTVLQQPVEGDAKLVRPEPVSHAPPLDGRVGYGGMITLGVAEDGGVFYMEPGRVFAVRLVEPGGTCWTLSLPEGIVEGSEGLEPLEEDGVNSIRTWTMHAEEPGSYLITGTCLQDTSSGAPDTFSITIEVLA